MIYSAHARAVSEDGLRGRDEEYLRASRVHGRGGH